MKNRPPENESAPTGDRGTNTKIFHKHLTNKIPQKGDSVESLVDAALEYAAHGWLVFPVHSIFDGQCACGKRDCPNPGKHPVGKLVPNGFKNATTDESVIKKWFENNSEFNIGIATGVRSGLVVLDIDGPVGEASLKELEKRFGPLPETMKVRSGGGGRHFYFKHPGNWMKIKSSDYSKEYPKVDIKSDNGCIVAPSSKHISGGTYRWLTNGTPPAACPQWIIDGQKSSRSSKKQTSSSNGQSKNGGRIQEGQRHSTLLSLAGSMRRPGMTGREIEAALLKANIDRCDPPLPKDEVEKIARDVVERYDPGETAYDRERIETAINEGTVEAGFSVVDALARLSIPDYASSRARLKAGCKGINLNLLDKGVNDARKKSKRKTPVSVSARPKRPPAPPATLEDVVESYRKYLFLPDDGAIKITLAAEVANRLKGDPVWLLLIASSSVGKTEIAVPMGTLDNSIAVSTLTESSLLSGTSAHERVKNANGGVLRVLGERGFIVLKDFGV